jgi:hypothetical protein
MREGALILVDCLGFRGIWNRVDPEQLISRLHAIEAEAFSRVVPKYSSSMLSFGPVRFHLRLLSDTVVLSIQYEAVAFNSHEWIEFEGTLFSQPLMGGYANVDDDVFEVPGGSYRGVAPRSFDAKSGQWSIWWMDSRTPLAPLDPPVRGRFENGVGRFYADDTENGKPIRIRFIWDKITPTSCHWEQAYSPDGGKTWETNWVQDLKRVQ